MRRFRKNQNNIKKSLYVFQKDEFLIIEGTINENTIAKDLVLHDFDSGNELYRTLNQAIGNQFSFKIPTNILFKLNDLVEGTQLNWYLEFYRSNEEQSTLDSLRVGNFPKADISQLRLAGENSNYFISYLTAKGNLSLIYNTEPRVNVLTYLERFKETKKSIHVEGRLDTKSLTVNTGQVVLKGRKTDVEYSFPSTFNWNSKITKKKFGLNVYHYNFVLDFNLFYLAEDVYDCYLKIEWQESAEETYVRLGNPRIKAKYKLKESYSYCDDMVSVVSPYYTFKKLSLSFEVVELKKEAFLYLQKRYHFSSLRYLLNKKKDIWLVGERPYKAQDTGYHFFKYMRENHPEKPVYYVIDESSPELKNVEPLDNIIFFKSKKHIEYASIATTFIGSHHADYLFPVRTKKFKKMVKGLKVFLQHGVMGTKNMIANYGKIASSFDTDAFMVSSSFEKEMIITDFQYPQQDVFVTGLSRFDSLLKDDVELKPQILIIPTWRDWITDSERFLTSEYYEKYKELVHHPMLHQLASSYGFSILLCLHPNMQQFSNEFKDAPVTVINQGEVDVQLLMKQSALLLTDYSSVGFDFSFLHRPVIYYQFDRKRFIGNYPSHLDLDNDLPGDIVFDINALLVELKNYCENNFMMSDRNKMKSEKFLEYRDTNSSERVYKVVKNLKRKAFSMNKVLSHQFIVDLLTKIRRSRYYFSVMKLMYYVLRTILPIDKQLILFESGVGKQYSDSPRYIYEEVVERNLPYKKIWVYNKNIRFKDEKTKVIKRLSPQYYYYLARSGYWVNNQNFPTYISKRKKATYIQTWHGTPLKKMLFDIENIQGRDETYLERIHKATQNWDYLISPSEYATKAFKSAFKYKKEVLEVGYPRNDIFYRIEKDEISEQTRRRFNIPKEKKIILYAPTFRDNEVIGKNGFQFQLHLNLHNMKDNLGDEYILLLRLHIAIKGKFTIDEELQEFVINASDYSEIQDLYLISDILITDYSSVFFDYANTSKPILFFTYDFDLYKNEVRGFYMDLQKEAPGPLLYTSEEVVNAIINIEKITKEYDEKYMNFKEKYCALEDGKASERVVSLIFDKS